MTRNSRAVRAFTAAAAVGAATATGVWGLAAPAANADSAAPHNGQISYSQGQVWYAVNPDGTGQHTVTPAGTGFNPVDSITSPVFSPDGTKAVFLDGNTGDLWISNADGTGARLLDKATGPVVDSVNAADIYPQWMDDATVVFQRNNGGGNFKIQADGSGLTAYPAPGGLTGQLVFGPGGLVAGITSDQSGFTISIFDPATSKVTKVANADSISFSPDGKQIAYSMYGGVGKAELFVANVDGTSPTQLTSVAGETFQPVWSPDGTEIAFQEQAGNGNNLDVIAATGGTPKVVLANAQLSGGNLAWDNGPLYTGPTNAPSPFLPPVTRPTIDRLGGADRVDTAVKVSGYNTGDYGSMSSPLTPTTDASTVVLARDDQFADALSGNALAVAKSGPLLLTDPHKLSSEVAKELTRVLPPGGTVYLLGGEQALSPQVAAQVTALGFKVDRIGGPDRYATSVRIAQAIGGTPGSVALATGKDFPDALTAGAGVDGNRAGKLGTGVVLLTDDGVLPKETKDYLAGINPDVSKVYAVGGQGVAAVATGEPSWHGKVTDLAGRDRYATAAAVAGSTMFPAGGTGSMVPGIATGRNWPDALSGGALTGRWNSPLLLADGASLPAAELGWLKQHAPMTKTVAGPGSQLTGALPVFGGPSAVPDSVITQVGSALYGAGKYDVFDNRHLATIVGPF
ncbi:cell wall-binding repeat-containing protein [Catenulispora pinisilvae]|uniref:cell wall-binding repeat-containing protein n=1 Tax=Catenulispora pinisilvae TaxID=2705253 RepID=UPI0018926B48|nr:cell wall-binding repeat-containing protein [Catenulispora pinisilvae]